MSQTPRTEPVFNPSPERVVSEGPRDIGLVFTGDGYVAGYGDPKALGWVNRVLARTAHPEADLTAYNLGIRDQTSTELLTRWRAECEPRWAGRSERRLVVSTGLADLAASIGTARSRLNLANILDDAATSGTAVFVVGPPPVQDPDLSHRLQGLADAQSEVCARRSVPFVDCFRPLAGHEQWLGDLAAGDGIHPGQAGYGLIAWLVLHAGWQSWLQLD